MCNTKLSLFIQNLNLKEASRAIVRAVYYVANTTIYNSNLVWLPSDKSAEIYILLDHEQGELPRLLGCNEKTYFYINKDGIRCYLSSECFQERWDAGEDYRLMKRETSNVTPSLSRFWVVSIQNVI